MANVRLETAAGRIVIEVFEARAPQTAAYFLGLVDEGRYDGGCFYRSTRLDVPEGPQLIQGGVLAGALTSEVPTSVAPHRPPLLEDFETTEQTALTHREATVSLARDLLGTGFVLPELFICLGDFPQLDFGGRTEPDDRGFPAFGQVVDGLDVVRQIAQRETRGATPIAMLQGQVLTEPVQISRAFRSGAS